MGAKTGIEWTDATWNPIRGCSRVSEGCRHCYAERQAAHPRLGGPGKPYEGLAVMQNGQPHWTGKIEFVEKHLFDPLKWWRRVEHIPDCEFAQRTTAHNKRCDCPMRALHIFVNSMSDLFHDAVEEQWLYEILAVMWAMGHHHYQVLTKRPENMKRRLEAICLKRLAQTAHRQFLARPGGDKDLVTPQMILADITWPLPNLWLGVSVENQKAADERIPLLLQTPAAVRFISAEPLLGSVKIQEYVILPRRVRSDLPFPPFLSAGPGIVSVVRNPHGAVSTHVDGQLLGLKPDEFELLPTLDWVICGGESGPEARPMHPDWARGLLVQCVAAGVPFFFKQWGEWAPSPAVPVRGKYTGGGIFLKCDGSSGCQGDFWSGAAAALDRMGKHDSGAVLDGVEWKQFPEVKA